MKILILFFRFVLLAIALQAPMCFAQINTHLEQAGQAYMKQDFKKAVEQFEIAAKQGDSIAQFWLSEMYFLGKGVPQDYKECFKWANMSAKQGDIMAINRLGFLYFQGDGVEKNYTEAFKYFERSADFPYSQFFLGVMYTNGQHVNKNLVKAKEYFKKACESGLEAGCEYRDHVTELENKG